MPFEIFSHDDKGIVYVIAKGDLVVADNVDLNEKLLEILNRSNRKIHVVYDTFSQTSSPSNTKKLNEVLTYAKHDQMGWAVVIGKKSNLNNFLGSFLSKMLGVNYRFVGTYKEAKVFLQEKDSTIEWVPILEEKAGELAS